MKRITILTLLFFLAFSWSVQAKTPVEKHGFLTAKDGKLLDQNGEIVVLRGMSLFWSQWMPQYYNAEAINWLVDDWNITIVRAAVGIARDGYLRNPEAEKQRLYAVIDAAIAKGIYVIVDWHDHNAVDREEMAVDFFREVATKYGKHPNIIYETYNEPLNTHTWEQIKKFHTAVVKAIREIDPKNLIVLGSSSWSQNVDEASKDPLTGFENLAYSFHFYASDRGHQERLRAKADVAIANGLCIFVTEWGVSESNGNGAFDQEKTDAWVKWMEENQLSWCVWSIADKAETSAALKPGAPGKGGWTEDQLSPGGKFIRSLIRKLNNSANP